MQMLRRAKKKRRCTVSFVVNLIFTICFLLIFVCFCFVEFPYLMYTTTLL